MNNDFDKQIKNLLEDSTAADAGFELNKKDVWDKIELKQETKIISFRKWISHAAAVIIGILLCLPFLFHSEKEEVKTVTIIKTVPSVKTINDTVFIVQNTVQNITKQNDSSVTIKKNNSPENIAEKASQPKQYDSNIINLLPVSNPNQMIAVTEKSRPKNKVLHLVDIENENAIPYTKRTESYALFNKIKIPARMDDKSQTLSMIVSNQFFNSKN